MHARLDPGGSGCASGSQEGGHSWHQASLVERLNECVQDEDFATAATVKQVSDQ